MDNKVTIYGISGSILLKIDVDDNSYRYRAIMSAHSVTLYYSLAEHIDIPVGSYIIYQAVRYTLWVPENFTKNSTRSFEYTVEFGDYTALLKLYKYKDLSEIPYRVKFPLTAKPQTFLKLLVENMNLRDSGWQVGTCIDAAEKALSFNHEYCYDVLGRFASEWGTEWSIDNKTVSLCKVEKFKSSPLSLSYGKGKGIKPGTGRANQEDKKPVSLLYVQGGERNIDYSKYNSKSLLLPISQELEYEGRRYVTDANGMYIVRVGSTPAIIREDSYDASDIYPKRVGTITAVKVINEGKSFYDVIDNTIPSELNFEDCIIAGETMTIIFQTGMLVGKEFEVKYIHEPIVNEEGKTEKDGRRFEIVPQEIDGMMMPNETYCPKPNDTYAVFNISLPDAYVCNDSDKTGASWDMFRDAVRYFYEHEESEFTFSGTLDGIWAKKKWLEIGGRLVPGAYIRFSDTQFQPDGIDIRITGVKDYINKPYSPEIELSNTPVAGYVTSELGKIDANEVIDEEHHKGALQFTKRRFRDAMETMSMLEDAFLNFSSSRDPITVRTMQLLVGDESLQFRFVTSKTLPVVISYNITYDIKKKILKAPATILQHMTMGIDTITASHKAGDYKFWDMAEYNSPPLVDASKKYYMYAKVSKENSAGTFLLSETAIKLEGVSGYYHLLVGVLNSEYEGERSFVELYGFTEILPGRVTTDRIVSTDGKTYFDLVRSEIGGKIKFAAGSSGLDNLEEWESVRQDIEAATEAAKAANTAVGGLHDYIDGAFADGIITEAEAKAIEKYINSVNNAKASVEATYNKLYVNTYLTGTAKTGLLNAKVTLMGSIENLIKSINTAIADGQTTVAEKQDVDKKYALFNSAYADFTTAVEVANQAIQDELKKYSDEALKEAKKAKAAADAAAQSADNANEAVSDLNTYVDGAFADGIITEAEAKAIEKYINSVNGTKLAVEATYTNLFTNGYLTGTAKIGLLNAKVSFFGAIENLLKSINTAISDGKTTVAEKNDVDAKYALFNSAYADFNDAVEVAYKAIQNKLKEYSDDAKDYAGQITNTAKDNMAQGLGYTNYKALSEAAKAGNTIITGGKINTELIEATAIITSQILANVINGNGLNIGGDKFVVSVDENKQVHVAVRGRVEADEGVFYGSIAEPAQPIGNNSLLSFDTGFNFSGYVSSGYKEIKLPSDAAYAGVSCSIINTKNTTGYFKITCNNKNNFMYTCNSGSMYDVSSIYLYGIGELRLKAVLDSLKTVRWFIENDMNFSYKWADKAFTNGLPSPFMRIIDLFELNGNSLNLLFCADGNTPSISWYDKGGQWWGIQFAKSRSSHKKKYHVIAISKISIFSYWVKDISDAGFTVGFTNSGFVTLSSDGAATVYVIEYN